MTVTVTMLLRQHCSSRALLAGILLLAVQSPGLVQAGDTAPRLSSDTETATAGFYRLSWETGKPGRVELQQADSPAFTHATLRYRGPDRASVISGMPDGKWYYRVRTLDDQDTGPWGKTVELTVAHHPLSRAFMFFALGVAVFLATVALVLRGKERT
jgi:hypothetical protein